MILNPHECNNLDFDVNSTICHEHTPLWAPVDSRLTEDLLFSHAYWDSTSLSFLPI